MPGVLKRRQQCEGRDTGEGSAKMEVEVEVMYLWAEELLRPLGAERSKDGLSPRDFSESMALTTPWFWTCSFQNCVSLVFNLSSFWYEVSTALGN